MAVYTPVGGEELERFLAGYALGPVRRLEPIPEGIDNTNYLLETAAGRHVLTLFERRIRPRDLPFFVALMEHLAAGGAPCPMPVRRRDGAALVPLAGRTALIVTFLEGERDPTAFGPIGAALARLHLAGAGFRPARANDLGFEGWRRLAGITRERADEVAPGLAHRIGQALGELEGRWPEGLPTGAIHADLFPDNAVFRNGAVSGIYDFYFACTDSLAYDLAIAQLAWAAEPDGRFDGGAADELAQGYESVRPLAPEERRALAQLRRGAALRFLLTRLHDWLFPAPAVLLAPKDPLEYLRKLDGLA